MSGLKKNEGVVWISTFTRNLQRQLDAELDRLYPDPVEKNKKVVIRKGRENYFFVCSILPKLLVACTLVVDRRQ